MLNKLRIFPISLQAFADGAPAAGANGAGEGTDAGSVITQQGKTGEKVVYGRAPEKPAAPASEKTAVKESPAAGDEERSAKFKAAITGDYKDLYDTEVQKIINRRFKSAKANEETLDSIRPIIEALQQRYGTDAGDYESLMDAIDGDDAIWAQKAEDAGMTVEQYRQVQQLQRQNEEFRVRQENYLAQQRSQQQIGVWMEQAAEMQQDPKFKDFDLQSEIENNPKFLDLLKVGIPVANAYTALHLDDVEGNISAQTQTQTAKAISNNIRARGTRPSEHSAFSQTGITYRSDPSKWTKDDYAEVRKRVQRGEKIYL